MFTPEKAWEVIKRNAEKSKKSRVIWHSIKDYHQYSVLEVSDNSVSILKIDTGKKDSLKFRHVQKVYGAFEKTRKVLRGQLIKKSVVKETALVLFHPQLMWSKNKTRIIINDK